MEKFSQFVHVFGKIQMTISIRYNIGVNGPEQVRYSFSFDETPEEYRGKIRTFTTESYEAAAIFNQIVNKSFKGMGYKHYKAKDVRSWIAEDWNRILEEWKIESAKSKFGRFQVELKELLEKYGYEMDTGNDEIVISEIETGNEFCI